MKESVLNTENVQVGEIELKDEIFAQRPNKALIYEVVRMQMTNRRQGDAASRNRALVSGTTAKMYRQKGTGRARHGDYRANIFVGGGKAFGPKTRDYSYRMPAKARRQGLCSALSLKKRDGKLMILDDFSLDQIKTKAALEKLAKLGVSNGLVVVAGNDETLVKSLRNIPKIKLIRWEGLNVYDMMRYDQTIMTRAALEKLQEVLKP